MASATASANPTDRPSFAKIAAAGLKPSCNGNTNTPTSPGNTMLAGQHVAVRSQHDGDTLPSIASNLHQTVAKPKKLMQLAGKELHEQRQTSSTDAGLSAHSVGAHRIEKPLSSNEERLLPATSDEAGTQVSSSNDSTKPASLDGRSITSGTTFALDEKESLRPDDSASVKAAEDEDSVPGLGSDDGIRAFRDQLREINTIDRSRRGTEVYPPAASSRGALYVPPPGSGVGMRPDVTQPSEPNTSAVSISPDPKLLEALESPRDRIWVLKLEQDIIDFVKDAKESSLNLPQCNSFYRMLAHKIADYYMLDHFVDESVSAVRLHKTPNCRIPPPLTGITTPSTAASTPPPAGPQLKILRRGETGNASNGSNLASNNTSEAGESGEDDKKLNRPPQSREEREARYEAARLRIMGSAKPSESPEAARDESRASSTTGKKARKPKRANSDDDFESRTNFNSYFANGNSTPTFVQEPASIASQGTAYTGYNSRAALDFQAFQHGIPAYTPQVASDNNWQYQGFNVAETPQPWNAGFPSPYDLSADFQRSMSFSQPVYQGHGQTPYTQDASYGSAAYGQQPLWASPPYGTPYQQVPSQFSQGYSPAYSPRPSSSASQQSQHNQAYPYGQLPSQAFPGRQPSKFEHPLPGSYNGQHFNPQSQTFVPTHAKGPQFSPMGLQRNLSSGSNYSNPMAPNPASQRQATTHTPLANHGSPLVLSNGPSRARYPQQPMAHPLPQPVFPRAVSPAVPLPPKPQNTTQRFPEQQNGGDLSPNNANGTTQGNSSISKWGVPASLPAKPPPSRVPSGGLPTFGMMPYGSGGIAPYAGNQQ